MNKMQIPEYAANSCLALLEQLTYFSTEAIVDRICKIEEHREIQENYWVIFWSYFRNTLIRRYPPSLWGLYSINDKELLRRTNNSLERYNRRLSNKFLDAHPNIISSIAVIKAEEEYYSNITKGIRSSAIRFQLPLGEFI